MKGRGAVRKQKAKYSGDLERPLTRFRAVDGLFALGSGKTTAQLEEDARQAEREELIRRFQLLFSHYSIERTENAALDFATLAMVLAMEHVPGLQIIEGPPAKKGRPKLWDVNRYMELIPSIELIKKERLCGDREACKIYMQRSGIPAPKPQEINALNARLSDARSPKKNWLIAHLSAQYGDARDAMMGSIIDRYGPDRK